MPRFPDQLDQHVAVVLQRGLRERRSEVYLRRRKRKTLAKLDQNLDATLDLLEGHLSTEEHAVSATPVEGQTGCLHLFANSATHIDVLPKMNPSIFFALHYYIVSLILEPALSQLYFHFEFPPAKTVRVALSNLDPVGNFSLLYASQRSEIYCLWIHLKRAIFSWSQTAHHPEAVYATKEQLLLADSNVIHSILATFASPHCKTGL